MALRNWSTSASGNASTVGINWAEGQPPSTVNDSAREMMAQVRRQYRPDEWAWVSISNTASVASQTSFRVSTDLTSVFHAQRRVRLQSASTTRYATVVSSSFTAETTVTVAVDAGSLSASHSTASLGPPVVNPSSKMDFLPLAGGTLTGDLTIAKDGSALSLNSTGGANPRLQMLQGNSLRAELGWGESGNTVYVNTFDNAGSYLATVLQLLRVSPFTVSAPSFETRNNGSRFFNVLQVDGAATLLSTLQVNGQIATSAQETVINSGSTVARLRTITPTRQWSAGGVVSNYEISDESGVQLRMSMQPGGPTRIVNGNGNLHGPGAFFPKNGDDNWFLSSDGNTNTLTGNPNCFSYYRRSDGFYGWFVNGVETGQLDNNNRGFRSHSNAKAWLDGDTNGTVANQMNVSSITVHGNGDATVNFTSAIPGGYCVVGMSSSVDGSFSRILSLIDGGTKTSTAVRVQTRDHIASKVSGLIQLAVFSRGM